MKPPARAFQGALVFLLVAVPASADLGFLGPRGTFSDEAAETYRRAAPEVGESVPFETMTAVVEALRAKRISRGILPVVSTVAGFPEESRRLLLGESDPGFRVVAELVVPVALHVLVKPGTPRDRIARILSHPNALAEAAEFLDRHYAAAGRDETSSTAAAAERVRGGDGTLAAIASQAAARLYGLEILERSVQEDSRNATSFWVIARPEDVPTPERATRLLVILDVPAGSDALSATVASLYRAGLEVVFVNSLPLPGGIFGFRYLLSCSADEPVMLEAAHSALEPADRVLRLGWFD